MQYKLGKRKGYFTIHRLGIGIATIVPFHRVQHQHTHGSIQEPQQKEDSIITKKILVIFAIVAIVKISLLLML